jgi:hypothetical protein
VLAETVVENHDNGLPIRLAGKMRVFLDQTYHTIFAAP